MRNISHKLIAAITIFCLIFVVGCKKQPPPPPKAKVTLNYYKLFDNSSSVQNAIASFKDEYPNITVNYKQFTDPEAYEDLIVNEIAEGGGPDIFSLPNTWIQANYKKITPAPADLVPADLFANTFLDIAVQDLVYGTGEEGAPQVYGIPLTIDTLALYYNRDHFEKNIPERGKPGTTWLQFEQDVIKLRRLSPDGIVLAGAAIGRADNISRAIDLLYALSLQYQAEFYANGYKSSEIGDNANMRKVIEFIASFADHETSRFTWTADFLDPSANETEIQKFVNGDISMMFGYSHLYRDIINEINRRQEKNQPSIDAANVRITTLPQLSNDTNSQVAYAHYFAETVARTSQHPREAWAFLRHLAKAQNLETYYEKGGFKPTSRRDLIDKQKTNAIYRPFIEQLGYAKTIPIANDIRYREILTALITAVNNGESIVDASNRAAQAINELIPADGLVPPPTNL